MELIKLKYKEKNLIGFEFKKDIKTMEYFDDNVLRKGNQCNKDISEEQRKANIIETFKKEYINFTFQDKWFTAYWGNWVTFDDSGFYGVFKADMLEFEE